MRRVAFWSMLIAALVFAAPVAASVSPATTPSRIDLSICPGITTTTHPGPFAPPTDCGPGVFSAGSTLISPPPDNTCTTPRANSELGSFLTTQNPLGAMIHAGEPNDCTTNPPTRGAGAADGSAFVLTVAQTGYCSTTLTIPAKAGPYGDVVFPVGNLALGSYSVTATFPNQTTVNPETHQSTTLLESHASGMLHVGASFTEADTTALAKPGTTETFAVLVSNSVAGPGAGKLVSTRTANPSVRNVTGTEFYACGTISIAATVTYGKRGAKGVAGLTGNGSITGGTGNYTGLKGTFTLTGTYSAKTHRARLVLRGTATY